MGADASYTGYVRGTEYAFPRGGRWLFFIGFAIMFAALAWASGFPVSLLIAVAVVFLLTATYISRYFDRVGRPAFSADATGITFGRVGGTGSRCHLAWADIAELRLRQFRTSVAVEIVLAPGVPVRHHGPAWQVSQFLLAAFPLGLQRAVPAVAVPRRNPDRYRIPLLQVTAKDLRPQLVRVASRTPVVIV